jgi:hypothetical protein
VTATFTVVYTYSIIAAVIFYTSTLIYNTSACTIIYTTKACTIIYTTNAHLITIGETPASPLIGALPPA